MANRPVVVTRRQDQSTRPFQDPPIHTHTYIYTHIYILQSCSTLYSSNFDGVQVLFQLLLASDVPKHIGRECRHHTCSWAQACAAHTPCAACVQMVARSAGWGRQYCAVIMTAQGSKGIAVSPAFLFHHLCACKMTNRAKQEMRHSDGKGWRWACHWKSAWAENCNYHHAHTKPAFWFGGAFLMLPPPKSAMHNK